MSDLLVNKSASISPCGTWRYRLTRHWAADYMLPFVMLNPSTADAEVDDPTIRRCMSFARREGAGGLVVVNLFALRSPSPVRLREVNDPFGPGNAAALKEVEKYSIRLSVPIVCAWGAHGTFHGGNNAAVRIFQEAGAHLVCLGKTKEGHPRHPLYVAADQPLVDFP